MKERDSFVLHLEELESVDLLSDEKAGQLLKSIIQYVKTGGDCIDDPVVGMAFSFIKRRLDKDAERYDEICRKRAEAASSKWKTDEADADVKMQKHANASKSMQMHAKESKPMQVTPDSDSDRDSEYIIKNHIVPTEPGRHGDPVPYQAVIDYLNQVCGTKYHATTAKTRECIRARWREGARLEDFKRVIDRKARDWLNTDRAEYLRPETLFGEKFEGYLNAPESKPKKKAIQFNTFHQRDQNYEDIQKALLVKQMKA